jgi:PAS domain S-box-containing protein
MEGTDRLSLVVLTVASMDGNDRDERDAARKLQEVEATAQVGSWSWDIPANVVTWSDELYRLYGLAPQSVPVSYESYMQLLPADERDRVAKIVGRCLESGQPVVFTHRVVPANGDTRWHQCRTQTEIVGGRVVRMFGTAQDITERTVSEQALHASRARIVQAADEARRRLERDLHDGAQQRLTTAGLMLRSAQDRLSGGSDRELERELGQAIDELQAGLGELRALARGLHPAILTEEGLVPALRALVARSPMPVKLDAGPVGRLPSPVETAAYFVVSEALTNVVKHAAASSAQVTVECRDSILVVEVTDDGSGGAAIDAGSGLPGLCDRVTALDGRLDLQGPAEGGTRLSVELPCA